MSRNRNSNHLIVSNMSTRALMNNKNYYSCESIFSL